MRVDVGEYGAITWICVWYVGGKDIYIFNLTSVFNSTANTTNTTNNTSIANSTNIINTNNTITNNPNQKQHRYADL